MTSIGEAGGPDGAQAEAVLASYAGTSVEAEVVVSMGFENAENSRGRFDLGTEVADSAGIVEAVLGLSEDAIVTCDRQARLTSWNPAAERLFGLTVREALRREFDGLFVEVARAEVRSVMAAAQAGDYIRRFESEGRRPDGLPVPVSMSLCPLELADAGVAGVLVIVRDVTEQRLAQAALADVEARLEEAEALSHVGSWMWDVRTGAVQWSGELHRIIGVGPHEFDGTLAAHLAQVHPADRPGLAAAMEQAVEAAKPFGLDCRIRPPGGKVRVVHLQARPTVGSEGKAIGLQGVGYEVPEPIGGQGRSTA